MPLLRRHSHTDTAVLSLLHGSGIQSHHPQGRGRSLWPENRRFGWWVLELGVASRSLRHPPSFVHRLAALFPGCYELYKFLSYTIRIASDPILFSGDDSASTSWNPVPVTTTIEFRGMQVNTIRCPSISTHAVVCSFQAPYTFPVGVTTLWWFAPATGTSGFASNGTLHFNATTSTPGATNSSHSAPTHNVTAHNGTTHINVTAGN
jgi:hypothetical protein